MISATTTTNRAETNTGNLMTRKEKSKYFRSSSPSRIYELYSFTSTRSRRSIVKKIAFYRVWLVEEELIVKFNFTLTHIHDGVYIQLCTSSRPSSNRRCCLMYALIIKQIQALCLDFAF